MKNQMKQMKKESTRRRRSQVRRRQALRLLLLALPALFWSTIFAALAGVHLPATVTDVLFDAAQSLIALACLLLIALHSGESAFFEMPESVDIFFSAGENRA